MVERRARPERTRRMSRTLMREGGEEVDEAAGDGEEGWGSFAEMRERRPESVAIVLEMLVFGEAGRSYDIFV